MRYRGLMVLVLLAFAGAVTVHGQDVLQTSEIDALLEKSIVRVEASDCQEIEGGRSCSAGIVSTGFFVSIGGQLFVATTLHGVAYYPDLTFYTQNGLRRDTSIARVNTKSDLALLAVPNAKEILSLGFAPLDLSTADANAIRGKQVLSVGFKRGLGSATAEQDIIRTLAPKLIKDLLGSEDLDPHLAKFFSPNAQTVQLQLRLEPGDSGGPILLGSEVVGIAHGGIEGSSLTWAMPVSELLTASASPADVDKFLAITSARGDQSATLSVFSTDNEIVEAHSITLPLRYSFFLAFSTQTQLLSGYAERVNWYAGRDNTGYWFPGNGPIPPNSEAFPGSSITIESLYEPEPGLRETLSAIQRDEQQFLWLLERAALKLECQTEGRLGQSDSHYWPEDDYNTSLLLRHTIKLEEVFLARDRSNLFVYPQVVQDVGPFGNLLQFKSNGSDGPVTDIDMRFGLCAISLVSAEVTEDGDDDLADLKPINDALLAGRACLMLYLPDGTEMHLQMMGRNIVPALDRDRLYGILAQTNPSTNVGTVACDE